MHPKGISSLSLRLSSRHIARVRFWPRLCENAWVGIICRSQWQVKPIKRLIEGENRSQATLFPERLDEYIAEDNAIRVVDAFVNKLDLQDLGFARAEPSATGRPGYQPATLLTSYSYAYSFAPSYHKEQRRASARSASRRPP